MSTWTKKICGSLILVGLLLLALQAVFYFDIQSILMPYDEVQGDSSAGKVVYSTGNIVHERLKYVGSPADEVSTWKDYEESSEKYETVEDGIYHRFDIDRVVTGIKDKMRYVRENNLPILMWWTPFTGESAAVKKCWKGECFFTDDKKFRDHPQTKVFFFYGTDFNGTYLPLPRKAHHEWALLHEESPKNSFLYSYEDILSLFNHTSTFRQESDYTLVTQDLQSIERLCKPPKYSFQEKEALGLASVVYLQSGCSPPSDRDAYVNELMKYIQVDSYGRCLNNKQIEKGYENPLIMDEPKQGEFLGKYKFVLVFENAICNDYLTEKIWNAMYGGAVPVYKGAPNILEWMPNNHSIILVDDFEHPKQLAEYIKYLANNESAYEEYLVYKKEGPSNQKLINHMKTRQWGTDNLEELSFVTGFECMVCDRIHENRKLVSDGRPQKIHIGKLDHYGCPKPVLYPFDTPPGTPEYERTSWQYEFVESKKTAKKIKESVTGE